jgi:hypothetical protein
MSARCEEEDTCLSIKVSAVAHQEVNGVEFVNIAGHRREMERALPLGRACLHVCSLPHQLRTHVTVPHVGSEVKGRGPVSLPRRFQVGAV